MDVFSHLLELNDLAREHGHKYPKKRTIFSGLIADTGKHFIGVVGPRGVGKTVILRQVLVALEDAFYLSADTMRGESLFETGRILHDRYGINTLLVDEIHFQPRFDAELKKLFDFVDMKVIFSSSVALAMHSSTYDLARRVRLEHLYPFSFGEYVEFVKGTSLPSLSLDDIYEERFTAAHLRTGYMFSEYLQGGLYPFSLEEVAVLPLLRNILHKVISRDVPSVSGLSYEEQVAIERLVRFVGRSGIDGINYSSVSRNIGITKYKAQAYIALLEQAYILNPVFPVGANVMREPKVMMYLPYRLLFQELPMALGGLREDFVAETLRLRGERFTYLKTRRGAKTPDFLVTTEEGDMIIEVGGRGKGRSQFKGVTVDRKMILSDRDEVRGYHRPMFLLGYV
jgi:hypothetical protein